MDHLHSDLPEPLPQLERRSQFARKLGFLYYPTQVFSSEFYVPVKSYIRALPGLPAVDPCPETGWPKTRVKEKHIREALP